MCLFRDWCSQKQQLRDSVFVATYSMILVFYTPPGTGPERAKGRLDRVICIKVNQLF